ILFPHLAAAVFAGHRGKPRRAFEAYCDVAEVLERLQVSARAAAEVEHGERRLALDCIEKRSDILADVVVAGAGPERIGALVVIVQSSRADRTKLDSGFLHRWHMEGTSMRLRIASLM